MQGSSAAHPLPQAETEEDLSVQEPAKVILFNDEVHTFDEVITQLIKATHCTQEKAEALAWEVHSSGKAVVFAGALPRCMEVSGILEEIDLLTQIEV
jgi:ATP-dependent Clp protease adaptor protein ClpS